MTRPEQQSGGQVDGGLMASARMLAVERAEFRIALTKLRAIAAAMAEALENAQAYVDDAAGFPEQFKPGVVRRHQQEVRDALARYHAEPKS